MFLCFSLASVVVRGGIPNITSHSDMNPLENMTVIYAKMILECGYHILDRVRLVGRIRRISVKYPSNNSSVDSNYYTS